MSELDPVRNALLIEDLGGETRQLVETDFQAALVGLRAGGLGMGGELAGEGLAETGFAGGAMGAAGALVSGGESMGVPRIGCPATAGWGAAPEI